MQTRRVEVRHPEIGSAELAKARGYDVRYAGPVVVDGTTYHELEIDVADNAEAIRFLNQLAKHDAETCPKTQALAARLWRWASDHTRAAGWDDARTPETYARKVHALVRDQIAYVDDTEQIFRSSDVTLGLGKGNCVNTARLVAALALVQGLPAKDEPIKVDGRTITHTCARLYHDRAWHWAEATVQARYDEAPLDAARRLGIIRDDIAAKQQPCCAECAER